MTSEPNLQNVQEWLLALITHPGSDEAASSQVATRFGALSVEQVLSEGPRQSAVERLHIYRYAYTARLVECLADDFGAVRYLLGQQTFESMCRTYIATHPSQSPNLNVYGRDFPAFLRQLAHDWAVFAAELAELEWALVQVVHSQSSDGLSPDALQSVPSAKLASLRFVPNSAVRLLRFEYPVNAYLRAFFLDEQPTPPQKQATSVVVVRAGTTLRRIELSAAQALLLARLLDAEPLLQALDGVDATPAQLQEWFREWTEFRLFAALEL
jgi:hypothetical protein